MVGRSERRDSLIGASSHQAGLLAACEVVVLLFAPILLALLLCEPPVPWLRGDSQP